MLAALVRRRCALLAVIATAGAAALVGCGAAFPATDDAQVRRGLKAIEGIAQDGFTLGDADAPWTLSIIAAPTSYELDRMITELPALTERFVRPGRLRLQMRTPTKGPYGGNGEERDVAGALLAAGLQGRYWNALVRFVPRYRGGVQPSDLASLLRRSGVPDIYLAMAERSSPTVGAALDRADVAAADAGGDGEVVYVLERPTDGDPIRLSFEDNLRGLADAVGKRLR